MAILIGILNGFEGYCMKRIFCVGLWFVMFGIIPTSFAYQSQVSPKIALERLIEGNNRFMHDKSICPDRSADRRAASAAKQKPFAIVLGCSDSRVPPELAFDQGIGDLFVVRVAGNVVGDTEIDSVAYSAIYNGSALIVVLGHESCGAVSAVLANKAHDIDCIEKFIKPAVAKHRNLNDAIQANIQHSVDIIKQSSAIAPLIKAGKIEVVGAYYHLKTGKIRFLNKI
jgi:carbonic anhydrase